MTFLAQGTTENNHEAHKQANGSIMRLVPAVICAPDSASAVMNAVAQGVATHAAAVPMDCCRQLAANLWDMIENGAVPDEIASTSSIPRSRIDSSGHAPATLEAAYWAVSTTGCFRDAILAAANPGDDADTVGAVTGQIAGALYGHCDIPEVWRERLAWHDEIRERAQKLHSLSRR